MKKILMKLDLFFENKLTKKIFFILAIVFSLFSIIVGSYVLSYLITANTMRNDIVPIILMIIFSLILITVEIILMKKKNNKMTYILGKIGVVIFGIIGIILITLTTRYIIPIRMMWTFESILYCTIPLALLIIIPFTRWKSILTLIFGTSLTICLCFFIGGLIQNAYYESIAIVNNENIDTNKYLAFEEESDIARLPYEYKDRFAYNDELPIVDGAAAFFPMYSSFVEAMYPSNIGKLNQQGSPYLYNNTPIGYMNLAYGYIDIMFGVYPSEQQIENIKANQGNLELIPYATDAFVFFVNEKNPVESLTVEQVKKIYSGEITNWKEVGGLDEEIKPFQRNEGSGSQTAMKKFMGDTPLMKAEHDYYYSTMLGIVGDVADYKNFKGAIGFSFLYYAETLVEEYEVKMLKINGVKPNLENIQNKNYPIVEDIYMAVTKRNDSINRMIDFVLSKEGQYLVRKSGYTPLYDYLKEEDYEK